MGHKEEEAQNAKQIEREDAQSTLPVEVAVVGWFFPVVKQDRGNQKSGEDKKDLDASPALDRGRNKGT